MGSASPTNFFSRTATWTDSNAWPGPSWPTLVETFGGEATEAIDGDLAWTMAESTLFNTYGGRITVSDSIWVALDTTYTVICNTSVGDPDQHVWAHVGLDDQMSGGVGVIARYNGSNGYVLRYNAFDYNIEIVTVASNTQIGVYDAGGVDPLDLNLSSEIFEGILLELVVEGTSLKAYANGVEVISVTDSSITSGNSWGLWVKTDASNYYTPWFEGAKAGPYTAPTLAQLQARDGAIVQWKLAESSGTTSNDSGYLLNGTHTGDVTPGSTALDISEAYSTNYGGTNGITTYADDARLSPQAGTSGRISLELIFELDTMPASITWMLSKGQNPYEWGLGVLANGSLAFCSWTGGGGNINPDAISAAGVVTTGERYHAVATWDRVAQVVQLWLDGVKIFENTGLNPGNIGNNSENTSSTITIGRRGDGAGSYMDGRASMAAVYPTALTQEQIEEHYSSATVASTAYTHSATDARGLVDSHSSASAFALTITDARGLVDTYTTVRAAVLTASDVTGLVDSHSYTAARTLTSNDNAGRTDAASSVTTYDRSFNDSRGLVDTYAAGADRTLAATDGRGISDPVYSRELTIIRTHNDVSGLVDTHSSVRAAALTSNDSLGSVDSAATVSVLARTHNDVTGLVDTNVRNGSFALTVTDVTGLADTYTTFRLASHTANDATGLVDTSSRATAFSVTSTDVLGSTDPPLTTARSAVLTANDPLGSVDTVAPAAVLVRTHDDSTVLTDSSSRSASFPLTFTDGRGLVDVRTHLRWRTSRLPPDAVLAQTGLSGAVGTITDDPELPDGTDMTSTGGAVDLRTSFGSPGGTLLPGAGLQKIRVYARSVS